MKDTSENFLDFLLDDMNDVRKDAEANNDLETDIMLGRMCDFVLESHKEFIKKVNRSV